MADLSSEVNALLMAHSAGYNVPAMDYSPASEPTRGLRVLLVDDDDHALRLASLILRDLQLEVRAVHSAESALQTLTEEDADLLITDLMMPGMDGEGLLKAVRERMPQLPVVIMSGQDSVERAVELLQLGAADYIAKPFQLAVFRNRVATLIERLRLQKEVKTLEKELDSELDLPEVVLGSSPPMLRVWRRVKRIARTIAPVIFLGESGTGKEVLARALHSWSPRVDKPFVTINCGSVPEGLWESELFGHRRGAFTGAMADQVGLIEAAQGGTFFLDEVGEIPLPSQAKLLRFLESSEYRRLGDTRTQRADVRIVSATNRNLAEMVKEGRFREDLYYRLNVMAVEVPPLRDRLADLPELASHLLDEAATQFGVHVQAISPIAMQKLLGYRWPGNIRELRNKLQQAVAAAQGPMLSADELAVPTPSPDGPKPAQSLADELADHDALLPFATARQSLVDRFERTYLRKLLAQTGGNVTRAAAVAGIPRKALGRLIIRHDLGSHASGKRGRPRRQNEQGKPLKEDSV